MMKFYILSLFVIIKLFFVFPLKILQKIINYQLHIKKKNMRNDLQIQQDESNPSISQIRIEIPEKAVISSMIIWKMLSKSIKNILRNCRLTEYWSYFMGFADLVIKNLQVSAPRKLTMLMAETLSKDTREGLCWSLLTDKKSLFVIYIITLQQNRNHGNININNFSHIEKNQELVKINFQIKKKQSSCLNDTAQFQTVLKDFLADIAKDRFLNRDVIITKQKIKGAIRQQKDCKAFAVFSTLLVII